jgi:SAM-dependent methyltransferase
MVVSVDLSEAVDVNYSSHGHLDNLLILQADIYKLPFKDESFDKVFCLGVLQHTPNVEMSFKTISRYVRRGGELAIDVYRRHTGIRRFFETKRWARPVTKRLPQSVLYRFCRTYVTCMWPMVTQLRRIPRGGRAITYRLLIPDYHGQFALSDEALKEWAILDMFDMLSPAYDQPQSLATVQRWFGEGFHQVDVRYGHNGIQGRGIKSTA